MRSYNFKRSFCFLFNDADIFLMMSAEANTNIGAISMKLICALVMKLQPRLHLKLKLLYLKLQRAISQLVKLQLQYHLKLQLVISWVPLSLI